MRMRKKKNLIPRMERCSEYLVRDPYDRRGRWLELMPQAREIRLELGCGKGRFTAGTAAAEPDVLFRTFRARWCHWLSRKSLLDTA